MKNDLFTLTEEAREFFAPTHAVEFFRVIDSRTNGRRIIRAVAIRANGSVDWLDARTFEVTADEIVAVA